MISILKYLKIAPPKTKIYFDLKKFARAVTGDRLRSLNEDTLTGRFLLYLDQSTLSRDKTNVNKFDLVNIIKHQPLHIAKFDTKHIITVLNTLNNNTVIQNKDEFRKLLHVIDTECCKRLKNFDVGITIQMLHSFMVAIPHRITERQYFHLALDDMINQVDRLNRNELIHLTFFIGLLKKSPKAQSMLRKCIKLFNKEFINDLTKEDLCIIYNSTFKTSTKIKNDLLLDKIKFLINNNLILLNDPAVFVTLIKTLRHNRWQDEDILTTLTCTMFFNKCFQYYSFPTMCHILALYADYLYYDRNILEIFSRKCLEQLGNSMYQSKDAYLEEQPRSKDIKRFLWALSNLNFRLSKEDIESVIIPQIFRRIEAGEFTNDPGTLTDIILYLWMMQFKAYNLIKIGLTTDHADFIRASNLSSRNNLNLLLTCIYYEDPDLYHSLQIQRDKSNNYNTNKQILKRPTLKKIVDNLKQIAVKNDIDKYDIGCQVPYINIIGVTGFQKKIYKTVNIEVLDDYTCLKNTENLPTGLMQLKLRILDKCDEGLIVIETTDIEDCSNSELQDILQDEVSLVC